MRYVKNLLLTMYIFSISTFALSAEIIASESIPKPDNKTITENRNCDFPENESIASDIKNKQKQLIALTHNKSNMSKEIDLMHQIHSADATLKCTYKK
jgi:hypothetical protein